MRLATTFVPLRKVKPTASYWNFSGDELEAVARLVLEVEGIINPLIVRREEGADSYVILSGNFEYYAVAKANQIEPRCCESIEAFVIEARDTTTIGKQIALLRNQVRNQATGSLQVQSDQSQGVVQIQSAKAGDKTLKPLSSGLLAVFNNADSSQLMARIRQIGLTGKNAEKVVEAIEQERQAKPFASLREVVNRVKGLTYEKMIDLVEVEFE